MGTTPGGLEAEQTSIKKKKVIPGHLQLAIHNNEELNELLHGVTIAQGGVLPNIQAVQGNIIKNKLGLICAKLMLAVLADLVGLIFVNFGFLRYIP